MVFMVKIDPAPILPLICGEHTPFPATSKTVAFEMDNGCFKKNPPFCELAAIGVGRQYFEWGDICIYSVNCIMKFCYFI